MITAGSRRRRIYEIIEIARPGDRTSAYFDRFIIVLILLNFVALILESVESIRLRAAGAFWWFELVSVAVFTVEYALRLWTCVEVERYRHPITGRLRFALRPLLITDLLAILPFYLPFLGIDLRVVRAFRVIRLARIAKLGRYSAAMTLILRVLKSKREEILTTVAIMLLLLLVSATLMYYAEREAQPQVFGSIPAAMWWSAITLTTVGYGDAFPITPIGRLIGVACSVLGVGMFALPTGIIGAAFVEELAQKKKAKHLCQTCGQPMPKQSQ